MNALVTIRKPTATADQVREHMAAAKELGLVVGRTLAEDMAMLEESAAAAAQLTGAVHDGIREEARRMAEYLASARGRIERLLGSEG